jgi:hypothetical protein
MVDPRQRPSAVPIDVLEAITTGNLVKTVANSINAAQVQGQKRRTPTHLHPPANCQTGSQRLDDQTSRALGSICGEVPTADLRIQQ